MGSAWLRLPRRTTSSLNPGLVIALVIVFVVLSLASPYFFTTTNLLNIAKAVSIVGSPPWARPIVIIGGGFDASQGSTMAAAGMLAAFLLEANLGIPIAFGAALALGALVGVGTARPSAASASTRSSRRSRPCRRAGSRSHLGRPGDRHQRLCRLDLGTDAILGIPIIVLCSSRRSSFGWAMPRTSFGRYTYATGSNGAPRAWLASRSIAGASSSTRCAA